jgi:hypothetical protein
MTTNRGWDSIGVREVLLALGGAVCALALGVVGLVLLAARPAGASPLARPDIARSAAPGRVLTDRPSALPAALPSGPATSGAAGALLSGSTALPPAPATGGAGTALPPTSPDASTVPTIGGAAGTPSGVQGLLATAGALPAAPQRLAPAAAAGGTVVGGALRVLAGTVGSAAGTARWAQGVARSAEGAIAAAWPISRTTQAPPSTARSGSTSSWPAIHAGPADAARPARGLTGRVAPAGAAPGATASTAAAAHDPNPARPGSPRPQPVSPRAPGSAPAVLDAGPGLGSHGGVPGVALAAAMALAMLVVGVPADRRRRPSTWIDPAFSPPG